MGKTYAEIDERLAAWIRAQPVFFVATAPLDAEGHVNLSPKGLDTFRILDGKSVAYLDLTGSGVETIAHVRENGRITILFCAFDGAPKILRLQGRGEAVLPADPAFSGLAALFPAKPGMRSVIRVALERISDSCGYGVPVMRYESERAQLTEWAERKGPDGVRAYQAEQNAESIDGLPGLGARKRE